MDHGPDPLKDRVALVLDVGRRREDDLVLDQPDPDDPRRPEALGQGLERVTGDLEVMLRRGLSDARREVKFPVCRGLVRLLQM